MKYILTSAVTNINPTTTIQMILSFTSTASGSDVNYTFASQKITPIKWGSLHSSYDLEDLLMTTSEYDFSLGDALGFINSLIDADAVDIRAEVQIKLNNVVKFIGKIEEDSISYDEGSMIFSAKAITSTDILNETSLYDNRMEDPPAGQEKYWNALNPLKYARDSFVSLKTLLTEIFKFVNPALTESDLILLNDYLLHGYSVDSGTYGETSFLELSEALIQINELQYNNSLQCNNLGDILKRLAIDWSCYTGLLSNNKPFFKKLFYFDANNTQTLQHVYNRIKNFKTNLISYVEAKTYYNEKKKWSAGTYTTNENRILDRELLTIAWADANTSPWGNGGSNLRAQTFSKALFRVDVATGSNLATFGAIYTSNTGTFKVSHTNTDTVWKVYLMRISGSGWPSGTLTKVSGTGDSSYTIKTVYDISTIAFRIVRAREGVNGTLKDIGQISADFWYKYKSDAHKVRIDTLNVQGVGYDFLKNFIHEDCMYQIISMKENFAENKTAFEAIYLGAL